MKKSPIEIVRLNPVYKEKIDFNSAKLLRNKLYQLSKESVKNELSTTREKESIKNAQLSTTREKESIKNAQQGFNRKSIAVPPLPNVGSEGLLPLQVCNWLIYSHLLRWNYRCTIASFQSESHMSGNPENTFTVYDILDLLGISRDSIFYTNFLAEYNEMENKGTLYTLLKHCIKHRIMKSSTDVAVQVNSVEKTKSIAEKLKEIDEVFKAKQQKLKESSSILQNNEVKKTIENDKMLQIERKIEIENIKKREKIAYQMELENAKSRIKEEYEARLEILQQKQIRYQNEIQKNRALEQQEINRLKEQLVQELDNIQKYEEATKQEVEQKRNQLDVEAKILLEKKNDLQMKEYALEKQKIQATALSEEMSENIQKSTALKVEEKLAELKAWEEKLKSEAEWLQEERHQASKKANEVNDLKPKLYELEMSLKSLQEKYSDVVKQNTKLSNKLDSMADYSSIKAELCYTKKELQTVKGHLSETRKEALSAAKSNIQYLREQRSPEGREAHHLSLLDTSNQILLQEQCKRLEKEIEELHHLNERVSIRNDYQQKEIEELRRTVQSFEAHLYNSHNKLNNFPIKEDKNSMPQPPNAKQTALPVSLWEDKATDSIHSLNPSTMRKHMIPSFTSSTTHSLKRTHSFDKEKPLRFITEARKRIDYLQIEAEALEKKYGEYLQSQANLFWTVPTSVNTLFSAREHSTLSQNLHEITKTYNPYSPVSNLKSKFFAQYLHSSPALKSSSQATSSLNYLTIDNIPRTLGGKRFHLAESTNINIQQESPQSKSESNTLDKNKFILDTQPHETNSSLSKKNMGELIGNDQTNESSKDAHKLISNGKEIIEEKESAHSINSKELSTHVSKASDINISNDRRGSNGTDLEHSSRNYNSLKVFDKDPNIKSEACNHLNAIEAVTKEESNHPSEKENASSLNLSSKKNSNHSEVQDKSSLTGKTDGKQLENIGLFHQDNSFEKHSLKSDHHVEASLNSSEKHSLNKSALEKNISSESHNKNVHTLLSATNDNEKVQETQKKNFSQEGEIGDAFGISLHVEIEQFPINSKDLLPENDHSISSKANDNGNSSSHKTDAPEISELSISAGSAARASKGSEGSDFW